MTGIALLSPSNIAIVLGLLALGWIAWRGFIARRAQARREHELRLALVRIQQQHWLLQRDYAQLDRSIWERLSEIIDS
jgi:hypothetical protein